MTLRAEESLLWPVCTSPADLPEIERVPLAERGLPASTYAALVRAAELWPDRKAATVLPDAVRYDEPVVLTFAELAGRVTRAANALIALGVSRTDPVALVSVNCVELMVTTLAAQAAGIAAPVNPALVGDHLADLLQRGGARVLVAAGPELDARVWASCRSAATTLGLSTLLALRPTGATGTGPELEPLDGLVVAYLEDLAALQPGHELQSPLPGGDDLAAFFHTGGTTGAPKLAVHSHANEVANAWMIAVNAGVEDDTAIFAALPLFHVNALVVTLVAPLLRGHHVVWAGPLGYREPALYANFWRIVEAHRLAVMSGVPTVYAVLASMPVDADISSLRLAVSGASALPASVRASWETHTGVALLEGYGLTEATCASARNFPDEPRAGSVGQRMPYQHAKTVSIDPASGAWTDLPVGTVGNLAFAGPTVFAGYLVSNGPAGPVLEGKDKLVDGWLDTGDLARLDEDGYIYLVGRAKDLIIRGGHNIDPAVIEEALLGHPAVTGACAVGRPDPRAGEVPVAYVTLRPGTPENPTPTPEELRSWAAARVAEPAAAPKLVTVVDALPLTDVGKPYKVALRLDATSREVADALDVPVEKVVCELREGSIHVVVHALLAATSVAKILDPYGFTWSLGDDA